MEEEQRAAAILSGLPPAPGGSSNLASEGLEKRKLREAGTAVKMTMTAAREKIETVYRCVSVYSICVCICTVCICAVCCTVCMSCLSEYPCVCHVCPCICVSVCMYVVHAYGYVCVCVCHNMYALSAHPWDEPTGPPAS